MALSTDRATAAVFDDALERLLALEAGAEQLLGHALRLDPGFALGHAVAATVAPSLGEAREHLHAARAASGRTDEREGSFVTAALLWCTPGFDGDRAMLRHVNSWPADAWAVSLLTPSIASAGIGDGTVEVWPLLDQIASAYPSGDWWLTGLRAFARTEQLRFGDAEELASASLAAHPASAHAAHATAHVLYETGRHRRGVGWLDGWLAGPGSAQRFRGHFQWHAALSELALGDIDGVVRRYDEELADLQGVRAVVDAGSMLVRCASHGLDLGPVRATAAYGAAGEDGLSPPSPFVAWNAALLAGLCADRDRLGRLDDLARRLSDAPGRTRATAWAQVAVVCRAVGSALDGDPLRAAALLGTLGPTEALGGSPAQRELLADVALHCLGAAGETDAAAAARAAATARRKPA